SAFFDNEEVGSSTKQGADSDFLKQVIERIGQAVFSNTEEREQLLRKSFLISADNAHALHPNHPEKADLTNRPKLNGGIVIKYHGGQKYTTDGYSGAYIIQLCKNAKIGYQAYCNRSDIAGGSTLGNIATSHVSVSSADIGFAQLAMHSAVETAGKEDVWQGIRLFEQFWSQ
ncbi:MAG TPA: M18 family aminopeptidase, partial [Lachnospiraceae bacterium]|nr:M18 family aminopeptidase [Lachnospiraceae bacterium]